MRLIIALKSGPAIVNSKCKNRQKRYSKCKKHISEKNQYNYGEISNVHQVLDLDNSSRNTKFENCYFVYDSTLDLISNDTTQDTHTHR